MDIEAILLTGGASRRMGTNKADLLVDGVPQAVRIARALQDEGMPVTALGRVPLEGCRFLPDAEEFAGPLAAIARFEPSAEYVFVCSCDLPRFDPRIALLLRKSIGSSEAAVPEVNGWRQPLCALYRRTAFDKLAGVLAEGGRCTMGWIDALDHVVIGEQQIREAGIDPLCSQGANTREEFEELMRSS